MSLTDVSDSISVVVTETSQSSAVFQRQDPSFDSGIAPVYEDVEDQKDTETSFWYNLKLSDITRGVIYGIYYSRQHLFHSYFIIPLGIIVLFAVLYGLNQILANVIRIRFPASVLGMLINLVVLVVLNLVANIRLNHPEKGGVLTSISKGSAWLLTNYLTITKPPMNFSLKWINVFFIPSFIILPLSDPITFMECLKIAGVFVFGFLLLFCVDVYAIIGLKWTLNHFGIFRDDTKVSEATNSDDETNNDEESENEDIELEIIPSRGFNSHMRDDITTIDIQSLHPTRTEPSNNVIRHSSVSENPFDGGNVSTLSELTPENLIHPAPIHQRAHSIATPDPHLQLRSPDSAPTIMVSPESEDEIEFDRNSARLSSDTVASSEIFSPKLSEKSKKIVVFITSYFDWILYCVLFVVSLPLYYISSLHVFLPYHLGITILAYYIALLIPQKWPSTKKFAHPILILTLEILFVCFIGSLIYHRGELKGFLDDLRFYKTGKNYLNLFNNQIMLDNGQQSSIPDDNFTATPIWPGCGDVLSSLMDISIVSLSLPMFTHRKDFVRNFWVLMPPILLSVALTFFIYPVVSFNIGIESERSIGFIGRSVTLALGTPLIEGLGGSVSLMAVCTILSGICGVLIGDTLFDLLRVAKNDYVTRGVSLGINCGAIATAHLLNVDPRAASMSSLSFSVFGTVMVVMASVGAVRDMIRSWVGL